MLICVVVYAVNVRNDWGVLGLPNLDVLKD